MILQIQQLLSFECDECNRLKSLLNEAIKHLASCSYCHSHHLNYGRCKGIDRESEECRNARIRTIEEDVRGLSGIELRVIYRKRK